MNPAAPPPPTPTPAPAVNRPLPPGVYRGIPAALQDLQFRPGSLEVVLFWTASQNRLGADGYRVFQDNENNLILQIGDSKVRQINVKMPANTVKMFYVCAVSAFGREGPKKSVKAHSNTDAIVVTGTTGATPGNPAPTDPTWQGQPSGGHYGGRLMPP